ncbi:MAG: NapC/NirT family cytochrome c [Desulfobaccales bacterium]|jgi:nitrate/TMAO reductase-like tetraheme cytochrome c subunit
MNGNKPPRSKFVSALFANWVGVFGLVLAISSLFVTFCLIGFDLFHGFRQPYMGILIFLVLPSFIWMGIVLAGLGVWLEFRRAKKPGAEVRDEARESRRQRQLVLALSCAFGFFMLTSLGSYQAFQVTESPQFCGALCHTVMRPEFSEYKTSPHARVPCTECHIGPGASWFVRSKISGLYQVYATVLNVYPRPIPVPVQNLRPAQETCEQCHWPAKFYGWVDLRHQFFLPDKQNTPWNIRMLVHVGGANETTGPVGGIHWHMILSNRIEYIATDESRQTIPWVRVTNLKTGAVDVYESKDSPLTPKQKALATRRLDCIDCHNRPTHIFDSPYSALDVSMWLGRIDPAIPSIKLNAAKALVKAAGAVSQAPGITMVAEELSKEYSDYQDQPKIRQAIVETQRIFEDNFFPEMKTDWRVRPNNIGHYIWPGCFRCHDGSHVDKAGQAISNACDTCHTIITQGAPGKPQTVNLEGLKFDHPGGEIPPDILCNQCHTGAP